VPTFVITTLSIIGLFAPSSTERGRDEKLSMGSRADSELTCDHCEKVTSILMQASTVWDIPQRQ
jgi:hypothetical protein